LTFAEAVVPALSKAVRVLPSEIRKGGPVHYTGDLTVLLGVSPASATVPSRTIVRAAGAPQVEGPTVILGDSYAGDAFPELQPYFASPIDQLQWVTNSPQQLVHGIVDARTVILETVEREFDFRATNGAYVTPQFISLVRRALANRSTP
jgi:hypothetical protein